MAEGKVLQAGRNAPQAPDMVDRRLFRLCFFFWHESFQANEFTRPGLPIIGHILQIPAVHSWLKFKIWTDELGPIVRFRMFGRENIVISSEKVANDLLRERGSRYSSREHLIMASEYLSANLRPLLLGYGGG